MIVKQRKYPIMLKKLEALLCRIPLNHQKRNEVNQNLTKKVAGYKGEQSLDYHLSFITEPNWFILHDIRIPHKDTFFQIDTLILSPSFFVILEVKNLAGSLLFEPLHNQLIRSINETDEVFPDPIWQVKHQQLQLTRWFTLHKCQTPPIYSFVVLTNSQSRILPSPTFPNLHKKVIRSTRLLEQLTDLHNRHSNEILTKKELSKIIRQLNKADTPYDPNILERYNISQNNVLTGVRCPNCGNLPMERKWGKWLCLSCSFDSLDAHNQALSDYRLLIKPTITNQQAKKFLHLHSSTVTHNLLLKLDFPHNGGTKGRVYELRMDD